MKQLLALLAVIGICAYSYAEVEKTYEKVAENVVKITETETVINVTSDNTTIEALKERLAGLVRQKAEAKTSYNDTIARLDNAIKDLETEIEAIKALGVVEIIATPIP